MEYGVQNRVLRSVMCKGERHRDHLNDWRSAWTIPPDTEPSAHSAVGGFACKADVERTVGSKRAHQ